MPGYDPRRSRPRPVVAPVAEEAPVDALLGPEPSSDATPPRVAPSEPTPPAPWPAAPAAGRGGPAPLLQLAPLAVLGGLVLVVLLIWERRRR